MLSKMQGPYKQEDVNGLYLLDTNIVYRICEPCNRHKKFWKIQKYQDRIAAAVMSGHARGGVVTDIVMGEMHRISSRNREHERFFIGNVETMVNDPKIQMRHFSMDYRKDAETARMFSYLKNNIRNKGGGAGYDEGEVSLLMAAYETGIPTVVTDDNDVSRDSVKNYMRNRMRERFGLRGEDGFRVVESRDFCREIGA